MLTLEQEEWVNHLSDKNKVKILPYDTTSEIKFQAIKKKIQKVLGKEFDIKHMGASGMKISGQDEIDVYIPVPPEEFDLIIPKLEKLFGKPGSHYPQKRARFKTFVDTKRIDVFLINKNSSDWLNSVIFENYLKSHPKALNKYRQLKEDWNGLSIREYYRRKILFINKILRKIK